MDSSTASSGPLGTLKSVWVCVGKLSRSFTSQPADKSKLIQAWVSKIRGAWCKGVEECGRGVGQGRGFKLLGSRLDMYVCMYVCME